jgi:hypothetical protein
MPHTQSKPSAVVGLSLAETETQAVVLALENAIPAVSAIAEWPGGVQEDPASIVHRLLTFVTSNNVAARRIAVTLDMAALFTHILPVPAGQADTLLHKHAHWDLAQFFPDSSEGEFITDVHLLSRSATGEGTRLLSVSVRRTFARALQDALVAEDFALHVLDGDHFSAEHYLTSRHPDGSTGSVLLVGLKRGRMDISVLQDGSLVDYRIRAECTPEACTAILTEGAGTHGRPRKVFLYGPRATSNLVESLDVNGIPPIEVLNPFVGMDIAPGNPLATHFLAMPHRFVPAVGAALREE